MISNIIDFHDTRITIRDMKTHIMMVNPLAPGLVTAVHQLARRSAGRPASLNYYSAAIQETTDWIVITRCEQVSWAALRTQIRRHALSPRCSNVLFLAAYSLSCVLRRRL